MSNANYNFTGLALVKHDGSDNLYLFRFPSNTYLAIGDKVMVETKYGNEIGTVVEEECCVVVGSKSYNMTVKAAGATLPLSRVLGKFVPISYEEEEENGGDI